jgi:hypothetical protein
MSYSLANNRTETDKGEGWGHHERGVGTSVTPPVGV